jgi:hypothetical protein
MPLPAMRGIAVAVLLVGCASGRTVAPIADDADTSTLADAGVDIDAPITPPVDAPMVDAKPPVDAKPIDAPPPPPPDAYVCTVKTMQLLQNPVFDLAPPGTSWVLQNIDNAYPIVTDQDGVPEQSAPYKAWLGGFTGQEKGTASVSDTLYQDIAIPPGTTQLVLTGYYEVRTAETTTTTAFDTAQLALVQTNGTPIAVVSTLSNLNKTTAWTAINYSFANAAALSGQTVRLRMTSTNDIIDVTSFYFDTFALTATYCQ